MNQLERFHKLFVDHYDGHPWIEVNLAATLEGITAADAAQKIGRLNSIWQIVNHLVSWRETLLKRINGESAPAPENNFIEDITDASSVAWKKTMERLQVSQGKLIAYLSGTEATGLDENPRQEQYSRYELIESILQHDVYHLGQIVLIKKLLRDKFT